MRRNTVRIASPSEPAVNVLHPFVDRAHTVGQAQLSVTNHFTDIDPTLSCVNQRHIKSLNKYCLKERFDEAIPEYMPW